MKNKYQEALYALANIVVDEMADGYNEPRTLRDYHFCTFNTLQELVDKEWPKIVEFDNSDLIFQLHGVEMPENIRLACPSCHTPLIVPYRDFYCSKCGQKIFLRKRGEE